MKALSNYLLEHEDCLGHELKIGDYISFASSGIHPYGQIVDITDGDKPKYVVKTLGWRGDPNKKPKEQYKVNVTANHVFQLEMNFQPGVEDELRKKGIII